MPNLFLLDKERILFDIAIPLLKNQEYQKIERALKFFSRSIFNIPGLRFDLKLFFTLRDRFEKANFLQHIFDIFISEEIPDDEETERIDSWLQNFIYLALKKCGNQKFEEIINMKNIRGETLLKLTEDYNLINSTQCLKDIARVKSILIEGINYRDETGVLHYIERDDISEDETHSMPWEQDSNDELQGLPDPEDSEEYASSHNSLSGNSSLNPEDFGEDKL